MIKQISVEEIINIVDTTWEGVNKSVLGPIIRDNVEVKEMGAESWKPTERISILNMASYETFKMVLMAQINILVTIKEGGFNG